MAEQIAPALKPGAIVTDLARFGLQRRHQNALAVHLEDAHVGLLPAQVARHRRQHVLHRVQRALSRAELRTPLGHDGGAGTVLDLLPAPGHSAEDDVSEGEFYALMKEKIPPVAATGFAVAPSLEQLHRIAAVTGETSVNRLALGAASGTSAARIKANATG